MPQYNVQRAVDTKYKMILLLQTSTDVNDKNHLSYMNEQVEKACGTCPLMSACTRSPKGRIIFRFEDQPWKDAYIKRMESAQGKAKLAQRKREVDQKKVLGDYGIASQSQLPILNRTRIIEIFQLM